MQELDWSSNFALPISLAQEGLKEYHQKELAADLGKAYGENTASPPKGRRAGEQIMVFLAT